MGVASDSLTLTLHTMPCALASRPSCLLARERKDAGMDSDVYDGRPSPPVTAHASDIEKGEA